MEIRTIDIPPFYYHYRDEQLPEDIISGQRKRFGFSESRMSTVVTPLVPVPKIEKVEPSPQEGWFPDW